VGRDEKKAAAARENGSFNPRARVGRDAGQDGSIRAYMGFNPRARVGRDVCIAAGLLQ